MRIRWENFLHVQNDGDTVIVIKDLPVKDAPKPIKAKTKVKNIRLTDGDQNIDCKIDVFSSVALKSASVRKASVTQEILEFIILNHKGVIRESTMQVVYPKGSCGLDSILSNI